MCQLITNECNFIAIGAWNPSIIEPSWLRKQFPTLIPKQFEILFSFQTKHQLRLEFEKITLIIDNEKLIFVPKIMDKSTLGYITELSVKIHKKLEHTPIKAVGCNFVYKIDNNERFKIDEFINADKLKDFYEDSNLKDMTSKIYRHTFPFADYQLNIIYNCDADKKSSSI